MTNPAYREITKGFSVNLKFTENLLYDADIYDRMFVLPSYKLDFWVI